MTIKKAVAGLAGIVALAFGFASKGDSVTAFQAKLSKVVKVDTAVYLADSHTITQTPTGTNKNVG